MAYSKHLAILKQGVKTWNEWREKKPKTKLNLRMADLSGADLRGANLKEADLSLAELGGANLSEADLSRADLYGADLRRTNLSGANLIGVKIREALFDETVLSRVNLSGQNFSDVDISKTDLSGANLRLAKFIRANLSKTDLSGANLEQADLIRANLREAIIKGANLEQAILNDADLTKADLTEANLSGAFLSAADLSSAKCYKANLSMASLRAARLIETKLDGATLTGACLWEIQRAGWSIKDVVCEYVYLSEIGEETSHYRPGDFERLFADKTKVKLFYKDGISPLEIACLPALIQHLEASHTECKLRFQSIEDASGGASVTLIVENVDGLAPENLDLLRRDIQSEVERDIYQLRQALTAKGDLIQRLNGQVESLRWTIREILANQQPTYYLEKGEVQMGSTYNISGQAGAVGQNAHAHDMTFNQIANQLGQSIDLPALATQLAELREEMAKRQDSSPQSAIAQGEAAKAEIAAKEGNTPKVIEHLKTAGEWTLDFAKEIGKDVVVAAIKQSMGLQ